MTSILIHGIQGQMGLHVGHLLKSQASTRVYGFSSQPSSDLHTYSRYEDIPPVDVIIDFSHHSKVDALIQYARRTRTPLVIATSALDSSIQKAIDEASKTIAILQSENMSLGIHALLEVATLACQLLENFDLEIIERHHSKKVDAPSGTANMILNALTSVDPSLRPLYGRQGKEALRKKKDIGVHAVRAGNIHGQHTLIFAGQDEVLEVSHQAGSKDVFAQGAIRASQYLMEKKPGRYTMAHLFRKE